jgi:hypothetical protein
MQESTTNHQGNGNIAGGGTAVNSGDWVLVGSQAWAASWPTIKGATSVTSTITGNFTINGTTVTVAVSPNNTLDGLVNTINGLNINGVTARSVNNRLYLYGDAGNMGGGDLEGNEGDSSLTNAIVIASGTLNVSTTFLVSQMAHIMVQD